MSSFSYKRRQSGVVNVGGNLAIGGDNPIVLQSMTSTSTLDTDASVEQIESIARAGGQLVRLTAQGVRHATNLASIKQKVEASAHPVPLVADIHFNPAAAFAAVEAGVDKVRINPGNFVDPGRTFVKIDFTDEEYNAELDRLAAAFIPFLDKCRQRGTAIRIGVNHGSLSDRIMSRYGDTPAGMVESAMEFLRVAVAQDFKDIVISIKASNVVVMTETVRLLVDTMEREGMDFPLHLGVTEAGDGEDGRVKSAVGIGSLLADGIGDTIRVSLSEEPAAEIPVAAMIVDYIGSRRLAPAVSSDTPRLSRRNVTTPLVAVAEAIPSASDTRNADLVIDVNDILDAATFNSTDDAALLSAIGNRRQIILTSTHPDFIGSMRLALSRIATLAPSALVIGLRDYGAVPQAETIVMASVDFGTLLLDGSLDGIAILSGTIPAADCVNLAFGILQATRLRITGTEYIACPGCGRTLFDLQTTLHRVRNATGHLKGLKIGVMGCIVNGPGEMADADYGYVGAAKGHVTLYKGKTAVERNIPEEQAIDRLIALLKENGDWIEPTAKN